MRLGSAAAAAAAAGAEASEQPGRELALGRGPADAAGSTTRWQTCLTAGGGAAASDVLLTGLVEKQMAAELWQNPLRKWLAHLAGEPSRGWECLLVQLRSETAGDQKARLVPLGKEMGLPRFQGQVDRGHAMTTRLSIDDEPHQNTAPVHGAAEGGGR